MLITRKMATLKELDSDYDVWDAITLYEICLVENYNKNQIMSTISGGDK